MRPCLRLTEKQNDKKQHSFKEKCGVYMCFIKQAVWFLHYGVTALTIWLQQSRPIGLSFCPRIFLWASDRLLMPPFLVPFSMAQQGSSESRTAMLSQIDSVEQDMSKSHVAGPHRRGQHISLSFAPGPSSQTVQKTFGKAPKAVCMWYLLLSQSKWVHLT